MTVNVSCVGVNGAILGMRTVSVVADCGELRPSAPVVVPIVLKGCVAKLVVYLADMDQAVECPIRAGGGAAVEPGDTVTVQLPEGALVRCAAR